MIKEAIFVLLFLAITTALYYAFRPAAKRIALQAKQTPQASPKRFSKPTNHNSKNANRYKPVPMHNNRKETAGRAVRRQMIYKPWKGHADPTYAEWISQKPIKVIFHYNG